MRKIQINQLGYTPGGVKKAVIPPGEATFTVKRVADFSSLTEEGRYAVYAGGEESYPFPVTCAGFPPSKCYVDDIGSYSANEITIYWNSPVYFVAAALGW